MIEYKTNPPDVPQDKIDRQYQSFKVERISYHLKLSVIWLKYAVPRISFRNIL